MRDDLHRSVAPRSAWARVLRLANEQSSPEELKDLLVRAVRHDADWLATPWYHQFAQTLDHGRGELFGDVEGMRARLTALMTSSPSPQAQSSCEIALGCLAREGQVPADFKNIVFDQVLRTFGVECVELVCSHVAIRFGDSQAVQMRRRLGVALATCDLLNEPPRGVRNDELSIDDGLAIALELTL